MTSPEKENLAPVFAKRVVQAKDNLSSLTANDIRQPVYSETTDEAISQPHQHPVSSAETDC
jgi:hypothetical protein